MAFRRNGGGHKHPNLRVSFSVRVGEGKYKKGPSFGLWENEEGGSVKAKGSVKGEYAQALCEFLDHYGDRGVSVALFDNEEDNGGYSKKKRRFRDEDDDDDEYGKKRHRDEEEDEEEEDEDEEEEEEDEKPAKRPAKKTPVAKKAKSKKRFG